MTFFDELILTIIDKGILALVAVLLGYKIKLWLQEDQSRRDLVREVSTPRAAAYEKLWKATLAFRKTDPPKFDGARLTEERDRLRQAYFDDGGALYLSHSAASKYMTAMGLLAERIASGSGSVPTDDQLHKAFSDFRTQLKTDLLIYTDEERDVSIVGKSKAEALV